MGNPKIDRVIVDNTRAVFPGRIRRSNPERETCGPREERAGGVYGFIPGSDDGYDRVWIRRAIAGSR